MIRFLIKGIMRDRNRSLMPLLTVVFSVATLVLAHAYVEGAMTEIVEINARFESGHLKVVTDPYAKHQALRPNDLALLEVSAHQESLSDLYPSYTWTPRIKFVGLADVGDELGETREQAPITGIAIDLLSPDRIGVDQFRLSESLARGSLPAKHGEILISDVLFKKLNIALGQKITLISTTMYGSPGVANLKVVGTVNFGVAAMDKGAVIADIGDIRSALDMEDAASEIIGILQSGYDDDGAEAIKFAFNHAQQKDNKFYPVMLSIRDQPGFGEYIDLGEKMGALMIGIFMLIIIVALWNSGVRGGIRRYSEFGLRIAIGESHQHVYISQAIESLCIGIAGYILGTLVGLIPAFYLQYVGLDMTEILDPSMSAILFQDTVRARVTPATLVIGLIPGVFATVAGSLMSGLGIFKRQTAALFSELEI